MIKLSGAAAHLCYHRAKNDLADSLSWSHMTGRLDATFPTSPFCVGASLLAAFSALRPFLLNGITDIMARFPAEEALNPLLVSLFSPDPVLCYNIQRLEANVNVSRPSRALHRPLSRILLFRCFDFVQVFLLGPASWRACGVPPGLIQDDLSHP